MNAKTQLVASILALSSLFVGIEAQERLDIRASGPRPLADVVRELQKRFSWVVTYEDPARLSPDDIVDVTPAVRKKPGAPVLVPRGGAFQFLANMPGKAEAQKAVILAALVEQYNHTGYDGDFRMAYTDDVAHVVPTTMKTSGGTRAPYRSMLETVISVADGNRSGLDQLSAIQAALNSSEPSRFRLGSVPLAALMGTSEGGVHNQPARVALVRLLKSTRVRMSWALLCDPGAGGVCMFNLHTIPGAPAAK